MRYDYSAGGIKDMYLFFLRHFNDIDNMVPVVWQMAREKYPVTVYCLNPRYDIYNDYRLAFLKELGIENFMVQRKPGCRLRPWSKSMCPMGKSSSA